MTDTEIRVLMTNPYLLETAIAAKLASLYVLLGRPGRASEQARIAVQHARAAGLLAN